MVEENVEIFGRTSFGFGSVLSAPERVEFVLESRMKDLWKLGARVPGTPIESSLTFNQSAIVRIFDEAAAAGQLHEDSPAWSVAHSDEWRWVFMPYSWKAIGAKPPQLADVPRTFVNVSRYENVSIELEGGAHFNKSLTYEDGLEITGTLFDGALDLTYTSLEAEWGGASERNPVSDQRFPWRVCVVESLLAYKRGSEAAMDFDDDTMRGRFEMRFEGSTVAAECASGVCAPTIQTCTSAYWIKWCGAQGIEAPHWCASAAEL